jgi:hypothetical protein
MEDLDYGDAIDYAGEMHLIDWFAGMALSYGLIGAAQSEYGFAETEDSLAKQAYRVADAMLKERERRNERSE